MTYPVTHQQDAPAPAAAELARELLDTGWMLSGAAVRIVHTARLSDARGLTVSVSCEAGRVRLDFDACGRSGPASHRAAWRARVDAPLPAEVLAAVAAVSDAATNRDEAEVGDLLTAAGWRYAATDQWTGPIVGTDVHRADEDLDGNAPLPWRIRRPDLRADIRTCDDTPPMVIAAFALTPASSHPADAVTT